MRITENKATCNLISIMLKDSVNIQEMDAKWGNEKTERLKVWDLLIFVF